MNNTTILTNTDCYSNSEIKAMLKSYYSLPLEIRIDIDRAFQSVLITGEMFLFVALHYNHRFSLMTTCKYMGYSLREIMELNEQTLETIEALLNGYKAPKRKRPIYLLSLDWAQLLLMQIITPFNVSFFDDELLRRDECGQQTLLQRETGIPQHILDILYNQAYSAAIYTERATKENQRPYELETFILNDRRNNKIRALFEGE